MRAMKTCSAAAAIIGAGGMLLMPASADVVTTGALQDNTIYSENGNNSNGAGVNFFAGKNAQGNIRRGLVLFPVGAGMGIPAGSTITGATITLHMSQSNAGATNVSLHQAFNAWGEGASNGSGSGAPATNMDATWTHRYFNFQTWSSPGGDFAASPLATTSVNSVGFYSWSSPQLTALVQAWLDLPIGNFGLFVLGDETFNSSAKRFDSRENTDPSFRPTLEITYTVPAPGSAAAAGLIGGLIALRRRR